MPVNVPVQLAVAGTRTTLTVESGAADMLENAPYAHNDMDSNLFSKLPVSSPASSLSDAIMFGTPGVVADSNGFFHPLGDHAQTTFAVDDWLDRRPKRSTFVLVIGIV